MSGRVAFVVGCNEYEHFDELHGACNDAERFYTQAIDPNRGGYDPSRSKLLLSPTHSEFSTAVASALFDNNGADVFTLFFAGHGGIKTGSYYLLLKDSMPERLSISGYSLTALFTALNESHPSQVNIIIDACNAGGLVGDLGTLLKADLIGPKGSPSISLLAGASADEYANETNGEGVVTNLLLQCMSGEQKVDSLSPYLDLVDIAKHISQAIDSKHQQTPTSWGLNLSGQSKFCINPCFADSHPIAANPLVEIPSDSAIALKISEHSDAIWHEYRLLEFSLNTRRLASVLSKITADPSNKPVDIAAFVVGIATTLEKQAAKSGDPFAPICVVSVLLTLLLSLSDQPEIQRVATTLLKRRRELIKECVTLVKTLLDGNRFYLLGGGDIGADLFFLPIRISKVLGYIWSQVLTDKISKREDDGLLQEVIELTTSLIEHYHGSHVAVSDEQAAYTYVTLIAANSVGHANLIAQLVDSIFSDVVQRKGALADARMGATDILRFLLARAEGKERTEPELLANPSILVSVLLAAPISGVMEEEWDKKLKALDHQSFDVFIPASFGHFGDDIVREGVNNVFKIGHGVWSRADFRKAFADECLPALQADPSWSSDIVKILSVNASLVLPDRIPWFLECTDFK